MEKAKESKLPYPPSRKQIFSPRVTDFISFKISNFNSSSGTKVLCPKKEIVISDFSYEGLPTYYNIYRNKNQVNM